MSGMEDLNDLVHLQVVGRSQITKELEETQRLPKKYLVKDALHRNEETEETEPVYGYPNDL